MNCFSEEENKLITLEYGTFQSSTVVRRKNFLKSGINGKQKENYKLCYFGRVTEYFKQIGSTSKKKRKRQSSKVEAANVRVQSEMNLKSSSQISVHKVAQKLNFSPCTVYKAMKFVCKLKPYKFLKSQLLLDDDKKHRPKFCNWLLSSEIDVQNVIFTDEKFFTQKFSPNRQNTRF